MITTMREEANVASARTAVDKACRGFQIAGYHADGTGIGLLFAILKLLARNGQAINQAFASTAAPLPSATPSA